MDCVRRQARILRQLIEGHGDCCLEVLLLIMALVVRYAMRAVDYHVVLALPMIVVTVHRIPRGLTLVMICISD